MSATYPDLPTDISSSVVRLSGTVLDQADDGTPWVRNYYKEPIYNLTINHSLISIDQINLLTSFYESNVTNNISVLFKIDGNIYDGYFSKPIQVTRNDPYNWSARTELVCTSWNPSLLFKNKVGFYYEINNSASLLNKDGSPPLLGNKISRIIDLSGNGFDSIQTNDTSMGILNVDSKGSRHISFDGLNDYYLIDNISTNLGDHTAIFLYDPNDSLDQSSGTERWLLDSLSGRLVLGERADDPPRKLGFYTTTWRTIANPINTPQIVSFVFSGSTGYVYRNGSLLGSGVYTPVGLGGSTSLCSNNAGSFFYAWLNLYSCIVIEGALTSADRIKTESYLKNKAKFA